MGFSSGTYTFTTSGLPVVTGTTISSTVENAKNTDIASALSTCLLKDGTQTVTANIPMATFIHTGLGAGSAAGHSLRYQQLFTTSAVTLLGAMNWVQGADIASAATINLTTATGNGVQVTGTTTITAVTLGAGMWRIVTFTGILTLTHHSTNNNLPGGSNITTAVDDRALYWANGTATYCIAYQRADGGIIKSASQIDQEAGTAITVPVTPGRQHYHPSAAKGWVNWNADGTINASYNADAMTDNGAGDFTINWTTDFSSTSYTVLLTLQGDTDATSAGNLTVAIRTTVAAGTTGIYSRRMSDFALTDAGRYHAVAFGDQ